MVDQFFMVVGLSVTILATLWVLAAAIAGSRRPRGRDPYRGLGRVHSAQRYVPMDRLDQRNDDD